MPIFKNDVSSSDQNLAAQARCRAGLNSLLIKLAVLNFVVDAAIYGAAGQGEAGSLAEFMLLPLAVVSMIALVGTIVRRVASQRTPS